MSEELKKKKRIGRGGKVLITAIIVLAVLVVVGGIYLGDYYHADLESIEAFAVENMVEVRADDQNNLVFEPKDAAAGFIFYPGGKVEHTAYVPLMQALASEGVLCVLVKMPFHLAVFDIKAAEGIQETYPQITSWYIGGHSLGGSMAAAYLEGCEESYDGLVLLGSYSATDLNNRAIDVISIYGSEDMVMNRENYEENKVNLPSDFTEQQIDGGCHAYFGMYGPQEGDGVPSITSEEQIRQTADAIINMMGGE